MKRSKLIIIPAVALFLFFMLGGFGSLASNSKPGNLLAGSSAPRSQSRIDPNDNGEASAATQSDSGEDEDSDSPDLGKFHGKIDHDTYLRLRDEYVARKRGIEPGRPFDPSMRGRAIDQMERQEKNRKIESLVSGSLTPELNVGGAWAPIGPTTITNGQSLQNTDTGVSGRVTAIVVDPGDATKVYLGTAQGGVWRSSNSGNTWEAIFDNAQSLAIGALALAPDHTTLYVGTGEFNGCGDCFFGVGLYRIDTVTTTPTLVGPINPTLTLGDLTYPVFNGRGITKILVDPTNPATIFVSTGRGVGGSGANALSAVGGSNLATRGLWRSFNATSSLAKDVTFQKLVVTIDNWADTPHTGNVDTTDIVMEPASPSSPANPNNLLVAVIGQSNPPGLGGIYATTNALSATPTFTQVLATALNVRTNLAINKVGSVVTAYAATSEAPNNTTNGCNSNASTGAGAVRKQVDPFNSSTTWATQLTGGGGFCGGQCFYDIAIAVNPNDANEVYLGGSAGAGSCTNGMKKSTNGGTSFSVDQTGLHADSHALFYDAAGATIFAGNDGGVWKRTSSLAAGSLWTNLNSGPLSTLQFESIAVHPTDRNLMIGGTQDNGTEYQQGSVGNWSNAEGGDGGYCLIDQSAPDTELVNMYHAFFNKTGTQIGFDRAVKTSCLHNKDFWPTRGVGFLNAPDAENTSPTCDGTASYLHNGLNINDTVLFYAPMALGPGSPNTVYFGTDKLYRSTDRGDTMTVVSQVLFGTSPISSIAIWPGGDDIRMVGLQNGQVWATSTGSSTLVNLTASFSLPANPNGSTNKFVGRAVIDPNNKNVAYVALSYFAQAGQGIWKITNLTAASGAAPVTPVWTAAGNGIPSIPINGLVIDQIDGNMYAGTDIGVYVSTNGGTNWNPFGTGLPRAAVFDLAIQPSNRILRAGTHGRGVWEIPLGGTSPPVTVRLTAPDFPISENNANGFVTVSVIREGDATSAASVDYATSDTSSLNAACSQVTGKASERCDYATSLGTLSWAAGEAGTKTFNIPIINDAIVEGNEVFNVTLSNPIGVSLGATSTATVTILDDDVAPSTNPIDGVDFFITQQYIDFLGRMPDQGGFTNWHNTLAPCPNGGFGEPVTSDCDRLHVAAGFFQSDEFLNRGYWAFRFYLVSYNQRPTYAQFIPDMAQVGGSKTPTEEEASKVAFAEAYVQRPEFLAKYTGLSGHALANALWLSAGLPGSPVTVTSGMTNGQVLRATVETSGAFNLFLADGTVAIQYFGFLRRDPDTIGYQNNLATLRNDPNNLRHMIFIFIYSSEYRGRFGAP
jgi:hypothetical protein